MLQNPSDDDMRNVLQESRTIAVVGHSNKPTRASYQIAKFLRSVGYIVVPVNPMISSIEGTACYSKLEDIPLSIDIVNVFRRSQYLLDIVDEAIALEIPTVWAQIGVSDVHAQQKAMESSLNVIMDRCIKVEYIRLRMSNFRE